MGAITKRETSSVQDMQQVGYVARLEDVGHFTVFEEAYEEWFGRKAPVRVIEKTFHPYLRSGVAPYWVRSYTRHVIEDTREQEARQQEKELNIASCVSALTFFLALSVFLHLWTSVS